MSRRIIFYIFFFIIPNQFLIGQTQNAEKEVDQVIYMIGNTGNKKVADYTALKGMLNQLKTEKDSSTVLFLGNLFPRNFFPKSMNQPELYLDNNEFTDILFEIENNTDNVFVNPGSMEWTLGNKTGYQAVASYEELIENYLFNENSFLPDLGCPGPEEVEIGNNMVLLFIDTQWWLNRELKNVDWLNQECEYEGTGDLLLKLKDAINSVSYTHLTLPTKIVYCGCVVGGVG